ncbi:ankyrin repeat-containing domain, PGG domain protein [Tanacetum coccineum]
MKAKHSQSKLLTELICERVIEADDSNKVLKISGSAAFTAVQHGIPKIVKECLVKYPDIILYKRDNPGNHDESYLPLKVITQRQEKVYNVIWQSFDHKVFQATLIDEKMENSLHKAGMLAPPHRLNIVNGAALQIDIIMVSLFCKLSAPCENMKMARCNHHDFMEEIAGRVSLSEASNVFLVQKFNFCIFIPKSKGPKKSETSQETKESEEEIDEKKMLDAAAFKKKLQSIPELRKSFMYRGEIDAGLVIIFVSTRNFRPDSVLGDGGFGLVFKGWIDEQSLTAAKPITGTVIVL